MQFTIQYDCGCMTLDLDMFFPCNRSNAKKLFDLVDTYCGKSEFETLYKYLLARSEHKYGQMLDFASQFESLITMIKPYCTKLRQKKLF
nr:MAG TPA: hypothetical protein [Caudoviricetes sp.]